MKKFFNNLRYKLFIAIVVLIIVALILATNWSMILDIGGGSWLLGIILMPFFFIGGINIIRAFWYLFEKDVESLGIAEYWVGILYLIVCVVSYGVFVVVMLRL